MLSGKAVLRVQEYLSARRWWHHLALVSAHFNCFTGRCIVDGYKTQKTGWDWCRFICVARTLIIQRTLSAQHLFTYIVFEPNEGAQIATAVNVQLFNKSKLRIVGSNPTSPGCFWGGHFFRLPSYALYVCICHTTYIYKMIGNWQRKISVNNWGSAHKNIKLICRLYPNGDVMSQRRRRDGVL